MIEKAVKASPQRLNKAAGFILRNRNLLEAKFPNQTTVEAITGELRSSGPRWSILAAENSCAIFSFQTLDLKAIVDDFCPLGSASIESVIATLVNDLKNLKMSELTVNAPAEFSDAFSSSGFKQGNFLTRMTASTTENKVMPILPLTMPGERHIPQLAKLMHEAYSKDNPQKFPSAAAAEHHLRDVVAGSHGKFVAEASSMSGMPGGNTVSACFMARDNSKLARVAELFTHPLYRARGLATTEIAIGMNYLVKMGFSQLCVWVNDRNEIAKRLFKKLGFEQDAKSVQMSMMLN